MAFADDGYTVAQVFGRDEVVRLQAEISAYLDRVAHALCMPFEDSEPDASFADRLERIAARDPSYATLLGQAVCTDAHRAAPFAAIASDPRLKEAAAALIGAPVGDMTVRIRGNSSALAAPRHDWHSDVAVDDGGPCSTVKLTAWIPLVDTGPANGGLEVAVGRRTAPLAHVQAGGRFCIDDGQLADAPKVRIDCPIGSCLFLDRYTPHRALPNTSGQTRWSLVAWMKQQPS